MIPPLLRALTKQSACLAAGLCGYSFTQNRKETMKLINKKLLLACCVAWMLSACSTMFYPKADAIGRIRQGMSPREVTELLGKPDYRRIDHGLEEWEYRKLAGRLDSEPTVVIVRFEHGELVYMDSYRDSDRRPNKHPHKPEKRK